MASDVGQQRRIEQLKQVFYRLDTNHNQKLEKEELLYFLRRFAETCKKPVIDDNKITEILEALDYESKGMIDVEEWIEFVNNFLIRFGIKNVDAIVNELQKEGYTILSDAHLTFEFNDKDDTIDVGVLLIDCDNFEIVSESPVSISENRNSAFNDAIVFTSDKVIDIQFNKVPSHVKSIIFEVHGKNGRRDWRVNASISNVLVTEKLSFDTCVISGDNIDVAIISCRVVREGDHWLLMSRQLLVPRLRSIPYSQVRNITSSFVFSMYCHQGERLVERVDDVMQVNLKVNSGKNLAIKDLFSSDPYYKIIANGVACWRSKTVKNSLNPLWDEPMTHVILPVVDKKNDKYCVKVEVWDEDLILNDDYMGQVLIELDMSNDKKRIEYNNAEFPLKGRSTNDKISGTVCIDLDATMAFVEKKAKQNYLECYVRKGIIYSK
jgi:Ca2+-binding EF-hand superfamily protein